MDLPKKKIGIISTSLAGGGAERSSALLSFMLSDLNFQVYNIVITDNIDYDYKGILYNMGIADKGNTSIFRKLKKGFLLRKYLNNNNINTIIDNRTRTVFLREWFTKWIYGRRDTFYMVRSHNLNNYLPERVFLAQLLFKKANKLVCVSKAIANSIEEKYNLKNTVTIYNPVDFSNIKADTFTPIEGNYILFFGRIEDKSKNFSLMLEAYLLSQVYKTGLNLFIMGDGPDENFVQNQINKHDLQLYVKRIPYQKDPFSYVKYAKFTLLTSHYEGFPRSIIESLALGTPVVAVDCKSGPSEVIINEKNGLLVENYNPEKLANAIKLLSEDQKLYDICKMNASNSIAHLSLATIAKQWDALLTAN